jgi:integrase
MGQVKARVAEKTSVILSKRPGMHAMGDPPGLYLLVTDGARSWILRYMLGGRRRDLGLGSYGTVTLEEARDEAREHRKEIRKGNDPIELKREHRDLARLAKSERKTFAACVDKYLEAHADGWRNPKHRAQWRSTLDTYTGTILGPVSVAAVNTTLVYQVLEPIWRTKTETASRLRGRIESVLDWATSRGYRRGDNPARWKGHLDNLLVAPAKVSKVRHLAALPYADVGTFMEALRAQEGIAAAALEFAVLTAARSGEVRGAKWGEIDLDGKTWTIPDERMKAKREHRVPLSDAALKVIRRMDKNRLGDFVFPGAKEDKPLSDMSLTAVLRRMKRNKITVHGFRSTFRDWCADSTSYPQHVAEMALAHTIGDKVEAAYRRGDLFDKRTRLMAEWARYCAKPIKKGDVVPIGRKQSGRSKSIKE